MSDEINCSQSDPQVEQPPVKFESTPTPKRNQKKISRRREKLLGKSIETSFITLPLSIVFRPPPLRLSAPIGIIFLDVLSHRINQLNYISFIPTPDCPTAHIRRSEIWDMLFH
ncbi:hypothetical protein HKD37_06G016566 [Glycine soja]